MDGGTTLHSKGDEPLEFSRQISCGVVTATLGGSYTFQWRVIPADGHPITASIKFTVGDADIVGIAIDEELPGWIEWARSTSVGMKYPGLHSSLGVQIVGGVIVRRDLAEVSRLLLPFATVGFLGIMLELPLPATMQ